MATFARTTLAQFKTQLLDLLGDPGGVYWTNAEIERYILEAFRTWGALSLYWKDRSILNCVSGQKFYNLTSNGLSSNLTAQSLALTIESHLQEPDSTVTWTGSEQFSLEQIESSIERRVNEFLLKTGVMQSSDTQIVTAGNGRVQLDDATLDISAAYWLNLSSSSQPLYKGDAREFNSYGNGWSLNGSSPIAFSLVTEPALILQLAPRPIDNGTLNLISIQSCPTVSIASNTVLPVPNDLLWVVKWGVLADLLNETGISNNSPMVEYCKTRWDDGIEAAKLYPSVLNSWIGGVQVPISSLKDLDISHPTWQSSSSIPTSLAMVNYNLIALYPVSNSSALELELDMIIPATVPSVDGDYLQVSQDYLPLLLGYAHHLASFKLGHAEFMSTQIDYERFLQAAMLNNDRLRENANLFEALREQTINEREERSIAASISNGN